MSGGYCEYPPPSRLRHLLACLWEQEPTWSHEQRVIPDGCVDLIWLSERELVFAGADTRPRVVPLPAGRRSTGLRLRPGAAGAVLGLPASELRDQEVCAEHIWGEQALELQERLRAAAPADRRALLGAVVGERRAEPDLLVGEAAARLSRPGARVALVAAELGVSERTLHRRTMTADLQPTREPPSLPQRTSGPGGSTPATSAIPTVTCGRSSTFPAWTYRRAPIRRRIARWLPPATRLAASSRGRRVTERSEVG